MKKNIKILFTLLIAFTIMLPFGVRATNYGSSISFASVPSSGGGSGNSNLTGYGQGTVGVRLTLLDKDGKHIANSVNFMNSNKTNDLGGKSIYVVSSNTDRFSTLKLSSLTWVNCGNSFKPVGNTGSWENNQTNGTTCKSTYRYYTADQNGDEKEKYAYKILSSISGFDFSSVSTAFESNVLNNLKSLKTFISTVFGVTYDENNSNSRYWFILVEPIVTIDAYGANWAVGTVTEFDKSVGNISSWSSSGLPEYDTPYMNYSYLYFTSNSTSDSNVVFNPKNGNSNLQLVSSVSGINLTKKTTKSISGWNSYGAGLIWIGGYANPNQACPSGTDKAGQMLLPSTCTTSCSSGLSYSSTNCCDVACKNSNRTCGEYASNSSIWKDGWIYNSANANKVVNAGSSISTIRVACGRQLSCSDYYNTSTDFKNVILYSGASATNCCSIYETLYANNSNMLTRLYRDHPECYSCTYTEKGINASCSSGNNSSSTGDQFGKGTTTYNEQTCAYYVAAGKIDTASSNLVTRRIINNSCKVVCTETVNVQFPLVAQKYYRKGSYIIWPTNIALGETESQLVLNGTAKCWYYVNKVRLNNLYSSNPSIASKEFKQCVDDIYATYNNTKNIISYDLKGNFSVKYNDSEYGKTMPLTREQVGNVNYNHNFLSTNNNSILTKLNKNGVSKSDINTFVSLTETITYYVNQTVNYKIAPTYGYNYIYKDKYYINNSWGNSAIAIGKSVLGLKDIAYSDGKLEIDYNSIGGGNKTYSTTNKTYGTCSYVTTDYILHTCPEGTDNVGMNLEEIMIKESLSYDETVSKYCNNDDMVVCDPDTYYAGKKILKSCYDNETCRELTCNIHECTDSGGACHILNDCMTRQVEDYGKTLEDAKKICTSRVCDGNFGNIEYRVIDLKNPFPGNQASVGSSRLFNTDIQGRKPGSNWNSITVVKNEILENRGVTGDNIYNLTPLYEFKLTPSVIKNIRKYNDTHEYDDFTLSCKGSSKQACVSSGFNFRSKDYGFVSAINECQNISNLTSFNSCYNNDSTLRY